MITIKVNNLAIAEGFYENGEYLKSFEAVYEFLEAEPTNVKALKLKAVLCTITGRLTEAIETYGLLLMLHENYEDLWGKCFAFERIGSMYWQLKNPDLAIKYYQRALEEYESSYDLAQDEFSEPILLALLTIGEYQTKSGNISDAITTYERLLEFYSKHGPLEGIANAFYELGLIYYQQNDLDKALPKFLRAASIFETLKESDSYGHCYYYIGCIFFVKKEFKKSLFHFNSSIAYLEGFYDRIYDEANINDDPFYCRAVRLRNCLRNTFQYK